MTILSLSILWPVSTIMILSSLAVVFVQSKSSGNEFNGIYQEENSDNKFKSNIINAAIIVAIMIILTNVLVCLLNFECTKLINGYIIFTTFLTLFYFGGYFFITILEVLGIESWNIYSFLIILWNVSMTGVVAIFYKKGIPAYVTKFFQMFSCVLITWNMSKYSETLSWILLLFLILYDTITVLTPCGALNQLNRNYNIPDGLLFEYEIGLPYVTLDTNQNLPSLPTKAITEEVTVVSKNDLNDTNHQTNASYEIITNNNEKKSKQVIQVHNQIVSSIEINSESVDTHINKSNIKKNANKNNHNRNDEDKNNNNSSNNGDNNNDDNNDNNNDNNSDNDISLIKLGLGDFIFYGLIASIGARHSVVCFLSTYLAVLIVSILHIYITYTL